MASLCRSAAKTGARSIAAIQSKTLTSAKPLSSHFLLSSKSPQYYSRISVAVSSMESLMPLHSAIASCRLKSIISVDSGYWSCMSQGLALPL